jgi:N-succinyldiaminopimelate aminotransferase
LRDALLPFAQRVINSEYYTLILMRNRFYQILQRRGLMAGAQPYYVSCDVTREIQHDFDSVSKENLGTFSVAVSM